MIVIVFNINTTLYYFPFIPSNISINYASFNIYFNNINNKFAVFKAILSISLIVGPL